MSTSVEDGTAKAKKNSVKVGREFGGIAGIVVVGGVVAVGVAAGAIAFLRNRHTKTNRNQLNKDDNHHISSQKSAEICPSPNPNECFGRDEAELTAPSSENGEEIEPAVEIVESLSDLDVSPDWKDMNKSKEEGSPRSHFSRKTSIASTSSDSEDCSEVSRNNYTRDSEIDSSQMNLKEGDFYFATAEETAGKETPSHLRECVPDNEVHNSSVKQSVDPKIEYEESVDSCDGLQGECEEVCSFVELGGSIAEHVGEQKVDVIDGWEVMEESGRISLDCPEKDVAVIGTVMDNGNREQKRVCLEEDGGSLCIEQVHCKCIEQVDSSHYDGLDCMVDQVNTGEQVQNESVGSRDFEDLDYKRAANHSDETGQQGKLKESESKNIHSPIKEERQHEHVAFKELESTEINVHDHQEGPENDRVIANEEMLLCKEQRLQDKKSEPNVEQFSQESIGSEESNGCKDNKAHKDLDCSSNFEDLDYKGGVSLSDDSQHEEFDDLKENLYPINKLCSREKNQSKELIFPKADMHCHQNEQNEIVLDEHFVQEEEFESNVDLCLQERLESEDSEDGMADKAHKVEQHDDETVDSKHLGTTNHHDEIDRHRKLEDSEEELKCADVDLHVHQDGFKSEIVVTDEELILCKEQRLQEENFESNVEQCRIESEEELENLVIDVANNGEQCQYETVISKDSESSDYKESGIYWDEEGQNGKVQEPEEHFGQIKEQIQSEIVKEIECTGDNIHIHCSGQQNSVVDANEMVLPQEEKFEYNVENHHQERTELEEVNNCKLNEAHNGKECHYDGIDSNNFEILDHNDCESHADEICQNKEIVVSEQYFSPHEEQFQKDSVKDGPQNQIVATYEQVVLSKEQRLTEGAFESHSENWQPEMADSEELENCKADVAHEDKQCHLEAIDSREFIALGEGVSHQNGSCQCGEINSKNSEGFDEGGVKEQSESVSANLKEDVDKVIRSESNLHLGEETSKPSSETFEDMSEMDACCEENIIDSNEKEDSKGDALICKEEHQEETLDSIYSKTFVQDALVKNQESEELISKVDVQDLTEEVVPIIQEHSQKETADSIDKLDLVEDTSLKSKQYEREMNESEVLDNPHISSDDLSDMDVQCEETTNDSNGKEDKGGYPLICKEEYQKESVHSIDSQTFMHDALVENQVSEEVISISEELDSTEEVMPIIHEHSQETADSIGKLHSVEDLSLESKQYQRKMSDTEVVDILHISSEDLSDIGVQCERSTIDSNEKEAKEGNVHICKEEYQKESLDSKETQNFVQDGHVKSQGSEEVISKFEELVLTEEVVPIIQEHSPKETAGSIDELDSFEDLSLKNKQYQMKMSESEVLDNLHTSSEGMSDMGAQCEESTIDSNEKEHKEEDDLIFQEESLDSIDTQIFVQDAYVESQASEEVISKFEEPDLTEEIVPTSQEHSKETANSIDKLDSVEDFSLKNMQYERKMSESEVLDNLHISGEECKEGTIVLEELEQSENVRLSIEQCQQNIVDPEETIDLENVNQYKQCQRVFVNGKETDFSISNTLIPKGLCPNEIVDPKDLDNEDPQTKPKEVDANESEYSSEDTLCFEEKDEQETTDKAANEEYKKDPEDSAELEGVHTDNSEESNTDTHCGNDQKELNQKTSTHIVSTSCILVGLSKEIQVHKESTENEADTVMKSESGAVTKPFSLTKRVKSGCDPLQSDSTPEEAGFRSAQFPRNMTTRIRTFVCLFAFAAFLFLFASKLARVSTSADAI